MAELRRTSQLSERAYTPPPCYKHPLGRKNKPSALSPRPRKSRFSHPRRSERLDSERLPLADVEPSSRSVEGKRAEDDRRQIARSGGGDGKNKGVGTSVSLRVCGARREMDGGGHCKNWIPDCRYCGPSGHSRHCSQKSKTKYTIPYTKKTNIFSIGLNTKRKTRCYNKLHAD